MGNAVDQGGADADKMSVVVGLLADPGLPAAVAQHLAGELPGVLGKHVSSDVDWHVDVACESLPLDEQGLIPMLELASERKPSRQWDVMVLLTDLPRRVGTQPMVADFSTFWSVGLISMPALGAVAKRRRTRDLLTHVIGHLMEDRLGLDSYRHNPDRRVPGKLVGLFPPVRHVGSDDEGIDLHLALTSLRGRIRLLAGMVRDNRPWRLVPALASATAAAAATAAFGIFYSSIWSMADALPPWRLAVITLVAITAMVVWLIAYNHLWDRPAGHRQRAKALLYNMSTLMTLFLGVACMYAMLYVLALLAAGAVIDAGYLQSQLHHPVGIGDYTRLVWLACSMGTVAGALGSSLDTEDAVRQATYSRREQQRQARHRERADDARSGTQ